MGRTARTLLVGTTIVAALLFVGPSPAQACSFIPPASMEGIEASLTGQTLPEQDQWLLDVASVTGFVEYTVVHAWDATLDYTAASARAATRTWGDVDGRLLPGRISGGEPRGPLVEFNTCGPSQAAPLGRTTYTVVLDGRGSHPVDGSMPPAVETLLSASLGEPNRFEPPEFEDRHPSYDGDSYGWEGWLTWGRITWAVSAVLLIPVAAFGSWLYSTRQD